MLIITKYILKEHISPFLFGIATIIFLFILNILFRDLGRLLGKGLSARVIAEFFIYQLAWIMALAVPMAILIATLMVFGRLASENEIAAFKSSGVHLYRLIGPVLIASIFLTFCMERFNNYVLPDFNHRLSLLYSDISRKKPTLTLEPNVFFDDLPNYTLLVHSINNKNDILEGIILNDHSDPKFNKTIFAEKGKLYYSKELGKMVFSLQNGELHQVEKRNLENYRRLIFEKQKIYIPVSNMDLKRSTSKRRGDRQKSSAMLKNDIQKHEKSITSKNEYICKIAHNNLELIMPESIWNDGKDANSGDFNKKTNTKKNLKNITKTIHSIKSQLQQIKGYQKSINVLKVEMYKKFSIPVACLVFVLIGAPVGIMARQSGLAVSGGISIAFFLIYWSFLIGGEQLADRGFIYPITAMWLPNIVVGSAGIYLVVKAVRETSFIKFDFLTNLLQKKNSRSGS